MAVSSEGSDFLPGFSSDAVAIAPAPLKAAVMNQNMGVSPILDDHIKLQKRSDKKIDLPDGYDSNPNYHPTREY
ncbi:MAG: hypothetical protein JAY75_05050 [Candidatus Thiodiazotropha taylori]|nr:hypothetical protein [Candidatus Thiodiazotropha taylori]MCW4226203.1 hypothetical protein [Candidatus Thiodiazotropha endolucinida]MCG7882938.1 hypothetical protein [Candidatus Thiodiazotropha taylori]MCG8075592.1 hypothetical protein [Candidatus Thiodiazotropha taylori]MCG8117240.1 hypothetical protein [Candidatus Thiodiazotropha taylori]